MSKPKWWPKNPYPNDIFCMEKERYAEIVPDPDERTGLSGMLGREFWEIASQMILDRMNENDIANKEEMELRLKEIEGFCDIISLQPDLNEQTLRAVDYIKKSVSIIRKMK